MKINQQGFSMVLALLLTLVLVGLGFVGYRVLSNKSDEPRQQEIAQQSDQKIEKKAEISEPQYLGVTHTSSLGKFKMTLLNGWKIQTDTTYDYFFSYNTDNVAYDASKKPVITSTDASGVGGYVPGIMVSVNQYNQDVTEGEVFTLNDGTEGLCLKNIISEKELEEGIGASGQGKFVSKRCLFEKNGLRLQTQYSYYEQSPLDVESVEWVFKTIEILE